MPTVPATWRGFVAAVGDLAYRATVALGDWSLFSGQTLAWLVRRRPNAGTLLPIFYGVGVRSVPVVAVTGLFIGMVLAVQSYGQFHQFGLATHLGSIINISVVRELVPVLAATMLAGRVGSSMAAELGTMRVTEQVDALASLGVHPLHYLVAPRLVACVVLIPILTIIANFMGVIGGWLICTRVFHIDSYHYWQNTQGFIGLWDVVTGLIKPMFFGGAIVLISCHQGLTSEPGAEGVGKAATQAFVRSFIVILILDFFLALFLNNLYDYLWPLSGPRMI